MIQGQPIFTTNNVQAARHTQELQHVRLPNAPLLEPALRCVPQALRTICVFRMGETPQPTVLIADDRAHGTVLSRMVCQAFGLQESDWILRRLVEALPSFAPEQYVLSSRATSWDMIHVPVDLRPLGGRVDLFSVNRCSPCGDLAQFAIRAQRLPPCLHVLCRTSQGWFHPMALLFLLPYGDAFQVWPVDRAPVVPLPDGLVPSTGLDTIEDRFSTSLSLPSAGELAFHEASGANAVVLHQGGHTYACLPSFADQLTLRSAAMAAVSNDLQVRPRGRLYIARILPPLDRMPAIQFAVAHCDDDETMGVVDLRPVHGGVSVVLVAHGASPAVRIERAVSSYGEPDGSQPLRASLAQGQIQILHRESVVDPFAPLTASMPAPIVALRRRSYLQSGFHTIPISVDAQSIEEASEHTLDGGEVSGTRPLSPAPSVLLALITGLHCCRLPVWPVFALLTFVASVQLPDGVTRCDPARVVAHWSEVTVDSELAGVAEHAALAHSLDTADLRQSLDPRPFGTHVLQYRICVWSPGERLCFAIRSDDSPASFRERLLEVRSALGRGSCLLADPQPVDRGVHLVATSRDASVLTIVADTGKDLVCLDVPNKRAGPATLSALEAICPHQHFRLGEFVRSPLRNGDIVRVYADSLTSEVRHALPRLRPWKPTSSDSRTVYVSAADIGLMQLVVPGRASAWALERALLQWFGRQRCLGVRLHQFQHPSLRHVFCLPRRGRPTVTVALLDVRDVHSGPLLVTVDAAEGQSLDCDSLRDPWRPASSFWNDIFERGVVCLGRWQFSPGPTQGSQVAQQLVLGFDVGRAVSTGWRAPTDLRMPTYDLTSNPEHLGLQWDSYERQASLRDAGTQTNALFWPMPASPLFSAAMPVPRKALGCSFDERYGSEGTLFHLNCPHMHVRCTLPCVAGRHIWALRIGNWVRAACSPFLGWDEVLEVAGFTYWDLPGTSVHGPTQVWTWPEDISSLSGQCGHIMHMGSDPCLPEEDPAPSDPARLFSVSPDNTPRSAASPHMIGWAPIALLASLLPWRVSLPLLLLGMHKNVLVTGAANSSVDTAACDSTQTCTVAWCHELSCQSTHFTVSPQSLAQYFAAHAPTRVVQIHLWLPFCGPVSFEVQRDSSPEVLESGLVSAGHPVDRHVLHVAFDTQATTLDLLSVPPGGVSWWIVRDGISRELLRPVSPWYQDAARAAVTLNSHGQATSLSATPEVAQMERLPQGARGATATPLARVFGHLAASGLVLAEISIGSVVNKGWHRGWHLGLWLLSVPLVSGMTTSQVIVPRTNAAWTNTDELPRCTRIWTHTLSAPVEVGYEGTPDPERLAVAVSSTRRGVRRDGIFAWTVPHVWGDSAHILRIPGWSQPSVCILAPPLPWSRECLPLRPGIR